MQRWFLKTGAYTAEKEQKFPKSLTNQTKKLNKMNNMLPNFASGADAGDNLAYPEEEAREDVTAAKRASFPEH